MTFEIKCENCYADFKVPHKVPVVACPYCGYTFVADKSVTEIYYFKVNFDSSKAFEKLMKFILRNFGVPPDFKINTSLTGYSLHYIPFHTVKAEAKGICQYQEGIIFRKGYKENLFKFYMLIFQLYPFLKDLKFLQNLSLD